MVATAISCTKCKRELPEAVFNQPGLLPCPVCGAPLKVEVFPALYRRIAPGNSGEATMEESESSCFYHPQKRAVLPCDSCGRFLCTLCDCELDGRHLCPGCVEAGRTKGKIKNLENRRVIYDDMALWLSILTWLPPIIYLCWITAPAAIYISIKHWNSPGSIVRRTKIRFVLAIIIALLDLAAMILIAVAFFAGKKYR